MTALDTKVLRDARRMLPQLAATALVMACGIAVFFGMRATMRSRDTACETYYGAERFADAFTHLERAPEAVAETLRELPGVELLETRIVADVRLDMLRIPEPALGRVISLPDHGTATVNGVRLRSGRLPTPGRHDEVLVTEAFATAHGLRPGDTLDAVIKGKRQTLRMAFLCCRAFAPLMVERGSGVIINVASNRGLHGMKDAAHYAASKGGIIGLPKSLAKELGPSGVRVHGVNPGPTRTPLWEKTLTEEERKKLIAAGKVADPDEIAGLILLMTRPESGCLNGLILVREPLEET